MGFNMKELIFERKINSLEEATKYNKKPFNIILISNRYLLSYFISKDENYLNKALNYAVAGLNHNPSNYNLFLLVSFIYVELEMYNDAEKLLKNLEPNKGFLKNNDMQTYLGYMFIIAYMDIKKGDAKGINKFRKLFPSQPGPDFPLVSYVYLGILENKTGNGENASYAYERAYSEQENKLYLYMGIYEYFIDGNIVFNKEIFYRAISWMIGQGIEIDEILRNYKDYFELNLYDNISFYKRLYEKYNYDWILKLVCRLFYARQKKSLDALYYCKEADDKRLLSKEHQRFYIEIAYENGVKNLSSLSVIDYLDEVEEIDSDMKSYLYFILLSDKKFKHIVEKYEEDIINLGIHGLDEDNQSEYYLSVYSHMIINENKYKIDKEYIYNGKEIIKDKIFKYKVLIKNPDVRYVWIKKGLYKDIELVPVVKGFIDVYAPNDDLNIICLNNDKNKVVLSEVIIRKEIPTINISLLIQFYNTGFRSKNLMIAIADYLVNNESISKDVLNILKRAVQYTEITEDFRSKVNITIGNILNEMGSYEESLKHYYMVKDDDLDEKYLEPMLLAFVNSNETEKAIELMLKGHSRIKDKTLFYAIKEINKVSEKVTKLVNIGYNLLVKGWYDKVLINLVVKNYEGQLEKWMVLYKVLSNVPTYGSLIDEIILGKSMFLKKITVDVQNVFIRAYNTSENKKLIKDFIYFLCYKILSKGLEPELDVLKILEKEYFIKKDRLLAYSLSNVYINQELFTEVSREVIYDGIKYMEEEGILLPNFKKIKDKNIITPYIEKNQPFVHNTLPDRKVYINYKFNEHDDYKKKEMEYVQFGSYMTNIITFYGDTMSYYITEEIDSSGTIQTKENSFVNDKILINNELYDKYFIINNALVNEKLLKFDEVYNIIENEISNKKSIKGKLI